MLGNLVNWRVDQALLALMIAPRHVGYYAVAVSLSELPGAAAGVVKNVIFAEGSTRDDPLVAARAARTIGAVLAVCAVGGVLVAGPAVILLFGEPFRPAIPLAQVLFVATVPFVVEQAVGAGLLAAGRPGLRTIGQLVSATITVVALLLLVPLIGAMGAAVTSLLAYTVNAALAVAFFHRVSGLAVHRIVVVRREDVQALLRPLRRLGSRRPRRRDDDAG